MSKMNTLSQMKDNLPAIPAEAALPAVSEMDDPVMLAIASGSQASFLGTLLLFKKGLWLAGEDKRELNAGTRAIALMSEARHGWVYWPATKKPTYWPDKIGRLHDKFLLPDRETLSHVDEAEWPLGLDGKPEDPWRHSVFLPMQLADDDDEQVLTFTSSAAGARSAFYALARTARLLEHKHPSEYPIVSLSVTTYQHKKYGQLTKPKLEVVGWTGKPDIALDDPGDGGPIVLPSRDDMDDEIPF